MFYMISTYGIGYLDYNDSKVYTATETYYSRARDTKRGYLRAAQALAEGRYSIGTYLDGDGLYRFEIKTAGGLVLRSKKQYNSISAATKAGYKWRLPANKVKRIAC